MIHGEARLALCCATYDAAHDLPVTFLDSTPAQREALRNHHPFCETCRGHGLDATRRRLPEDRVG